MFHEAVPTSDEGIKRTMRRDNVWGVKLCGDAVRGPFRVEVETVNVNEVSGVHEIAESAKHSGRKRGTRPRAAIHPNVQ